MPQVQQAERRSDRSGGVRLLLAPSWLTLTRDRPAPPPSWLRHSVLLYNAALQRFWVDKLAGTLLAAPTLAIARDVRALDAALQAHVAGSAHRHHVPLPELPMLPVSGHHAGPITGSADEAEPGWIAAAGFQPGLLGYRAWVAALDAQLAALMPPGQPQP